MVSYQTGEAVFVHFSRCERKDHGCGAFRRHQKIDVVEAQKYDDRAKSCALVAIDKRMVAGNTERIRCRKRSKVSFAIGEFVDGAAKRLLPHIFVTNAVRVYEQSELLGVEIKHDLHIQPDRLVHFASAL
jgi:hypothetical protein